MRTFCRQQLLHTVRFNVAFAVVVVIVKQEAELPQRYPNLTYYIEKTLKSYLEWPKIHDCYKTTTYAAFVFNAHDGGVPWDDLRKILQGDQRMAKVQNGEEILPKVSTP